jgi:hypothetical protein
MTLSVQNSETTLRRVGGPYLGICLILLLVTGLTLFLSVKIGRAAPLFYTGLFWIPFIVWVYIGTRYKIYWTDVGITQKALGLKEVTIRMDEICDISLETSTAADLLGGRPLRRISIHSKPSSLQSRTIDISMKHFSSGSIRSLMNSVTKARPDISIPEF